VHHTSHLCGTLSGNIVNVGLAVQLVGLVKYDEVGLDPVGLLPHGSALVGGVHRAGDLMVR
jgi:hypothetical protein